MTIKEIAAQVGVTDKAIYKRLKSEGIPLESLKKKGSSALSPEGERRLLELYSIQEQAPASDQQGNQGEPGAVETVENTVENPVETVENASQEVESPVENSTRPVEIEVERLKAEIKRLEDLNKALIDERDFLRLSLERAQQLQAMTASKIPTPPALPAGGEIQGGGIGGWFRRHFPKKKSPEQ